MRALLPFWLGSALAFSCLGCQASGPQEPEHEGQSLSEWIVDFDDEEADLEERQEAAASLESLGAQAEKAIPSLLRALEARGALAPFAARALGKVAPNRADIVDALIRAVEEGDELGQSSMTVLLAIGEASVAGFVRGLDSDNWELRVLCAHSLAKFGDRARSALPALVNALRDRETHAVREAAALALGSLGSPEAIAPLKVALGDYVAPVRAAAEAALAQIRSRNSSRE